MSGTNSSYAGSSPWKTLIARSTKMAPVRNSVSNALAGPPSLVVLAVDRGHVLPGPSSSSVDETATARVAIIHDAT